MDKAIIFINPLELGDDVYCKLIIKDSNQVLLDRLQGFVYLERHAKSGCYIMPHTDHNVRMLADGTSDLALLNSTYMNKSRIITNNIRIDKGHTQTTRRQTGRSGNITIFPLLHKKKTFALLKFPYSPTIYNTLKRLDYVKYSKTYRRFVTHLDAIHLYKIIYDMAPVCRVQLNSKIDINDLSLKKMLWEQSYLGAEYKSCPITYLEKMKLGNYSINTMKTYHAMFMKFINSFDQKMEIIDRFAEEEINVYHREMIQKNKFSFSYINQSLNAIKYYYNHILDRGLEPALLDRPKKMKDLPKVLAKKEIKAILGTIQNEKHKTMVFLTYSAGIRVGELLELRVTDLDFDRALLHIQKAKGRKDRYTILSQKVIPMLRKYLYTYKPKDYLFEGQYGGKYSNSSVNKFWGKALKEAHINYAYTFHCLRHTFATHLLENGTDIRYIQQLLGHSSSKTTEIYTHVTTRHIGSIKSPGDLLDD